MAAYSIFNKKLAATTALAALVTLSGCSSLEGLVGGDSDDGKVVQVLNDARLDSTYDTSGFAFDQQEASNKAVMQAQVVCKDKPVQVLSDKQSTKTYEENGQQNTVYIVDMSYRCGM